ncbi:MAG: OmpA family protein [Halobacteriovoraceae bacterium]|nr:OmpA family protein [Halobacteriovoraceae bacterium]
MKLSDLKRTKFRSAGDNYYVSFTDVMMLLSVFFILIISISKIEKGSFERIKSSFSGSTKGTLVELSEEIKYMVEKDPGIPNVTVELTKEGVLLDLKTAALFDSGSAALKKGTLDPMKVIIEKVRGTNYRIDVEGHTDDLRFYKENDELKESNWSLSGRRAASVLNHILELGISPKRLRLVGYASNRPKVSITNKTGDELEKARMENRRVSLLIH